MAVLTKLRYGLLPLLAGWSAAGVCDSWQHVISVPVGAEYHSNPRMVADDAEGVWRGWSNPRSTIMWSDGRNSAQASLSVFIERSTDPERSQDREDPAASLRVGRRTETGAYGLSASYAQRATRSTAISPITIVIEDPDSGAGDPTDPIVIDGYELLEIEGTRTSRSVGADWSAALSERFRLDAQLRYSDTTYDIDRFTDHWQVGAGSTLNWRLSPRTDLALDVSAVNYRRDDVDESTQQYSGQLVWNRRLTERLSGRLRIGGYWRSEEEGDAQGGLGGASLNYRLSGRTHLWATAGRDTRVNVLGGLTERDSASAGVSLALSAATAASVTGGWSRTRADRWRTDAYASASLSWRLDAHWSASLSYRRNRIDGAEIEPASANIVNLMLVYAQVPR